MTVTEGKSDKGGIQVIARAASILRALRDDTSGLSLGQIAERTDLPRSTVQRITGALASERMVLSNAKGGELRLGPEMRTFAKATRYTIVETCRPILMEIANRTGETTDLAVLRGDSMTFLDQISGHHRLRAVSSAGDTFPLTTTANGRACLAKMPEQEARRMAEREWRRSGQSGDPDAFMRTLAQIRDTNFAYDIDEHTAGISAIGIAFEDWSGDLHAISVPIPSTRFELAKRGVEDALLEAQGSLEKLMM